MDTSVRLNPVLVKAFGGASFDGTRKPWIKMTEYEVDLMVRLGCSNGPFEPISLDMLYTLNRNCDSRFFLECEALLRFGFSHLTFIRNMLILGLDPKHFAYDTLKKLSENWFVLEDLALSESSPFVKLLSQYHFVKHIVLKPELSHIRIKYQTVIRSALETNGHRILHDICTNDMFLEFSLDQFKEHVSYLTRTGVNINAKFNSCTSTYRIMLSLLNNRKCKIMTDRIVPYLEFMISEGGTINQSCRDVCTNGFYMGRNGSSEALIGWTRCIYFIDLVSEYHSSTEDYTNPPVTEWVENINSIDALRGTYEKLESSYSVRRPFPELSSVPSPTPSPVSITV